MAGCRVINIEQGMPTVEEARKRLFSEIQKAKREKMTCIKIIHGYGSSGVGGKLKIALRKSLISKAKEGYIKVVVPGENWTVFDEGARKILEACREMSKDSDLDKGNEGITVVLL
jgi:hypothetical protein